MPICGYVAHPEEGCGSRLAERLNEIDGCEAVLSDDGSVVALITETENETDEERLNERIDALDELNCRFMTFASDDRELAQ